MVAASELPVDTRASAMDMANTIFGSGIFMDGESVAPGLTPSDTGVIFSAGHARDITNPHGPLGQDTNTSTNTHGVSNDAGFTARAGGANIYGALFLDMDFIPTGDTITLGSGQHVTLKVDGMAGASRPR